jgi:hypothetical protein
VSKTTTLTECPVCTTELQRGVFCPRCELDVRSRLFREWRARVACFRDQYHEIADTANRVCDQRELQVLVYDIDRRSDAFIADRVGLSVPGLKAFREQIHAKIREAIGKQRIAELSERRRYNSLNRR